MADMMTLEQVRDELRYCAKGNYQVPALVLADAIDAAIKQRDQGANDPLKGWIFDKLAEALRDATYVAGMLDAICETDGTVDRMRARDAAFRVRDALQAHTAEELRGMGYRMPQYAIDATIKQREQGATHPLKGWIFDKVDMGRGDERYICTPDGANATTVRNESTSDHRERMLWLIADAMTKESGNG